MKPKILPILSECIQRGANRGYNHAHKHVSNPSQDLLVDKIEQYILEELYEYFDFD